MVSSGLGSRTASRLPNCNCPLTSRVEGHERRSEEGQAAPYMYLERLCTIFLSARLDSFAPARPSRVGRRVAISPHANSALVTLQCRSPTPTVARRPPIGRDSIKGIISAPRVVARMQAIVEHGLYVERFHIKSAKWTLHVQRYAVQECAGVSRLSTAPPSPGGIHAACRHSIRIQ